VVGCSLGLTESQLGKYAVLSAQYQPAFDLNVGSELAAAGLRPEEILLMDVVAEPPVLEALGLLGSTVPKIIAAGALHIQECTPCRTH